jgi:hypothetical protein
VWVVPASPVLSPALARDPPAFALEEVWSSLSYFRRFSGFEDLVGLLYLLETLLGPGVFRVSVRVVLPG